jgi:hypothetical protein
MKSKPRCFGQCSEECCYEDKYEKKLSCLHECFLEMIEIKYLKTAIMIRR